MKKSALIMLLSIYCPLAIAAGIDLDDNRDELLMFFEAEEMAEIANMRLQAIDKAPASVTVITAQDIKSIGATNIIQALETVPGLHVSIHYQVGIPLFNFRGIFTEFNAQVLIMVNGIPINTLFTGSPDLIWRGMAVEAISRIEIIRGPGSAIYGADAFAGVINIITKTSAELNGIDSGIRMGSFNTKDAWLTSGGKLADFDTAFFLQYHKTDGHGATLEADAQTFLDNIYGTNASHAPGPVSLPEENIDLGLELSKGNWRLRTGLESHHDIGAYTGVLKALDPEARAMLTRWNADLTWHAPSFSDNWDLKTQFSYFDNQSEMDKDSVIHLYPAGTTAFGDVTGDGNPDVFPDGMISTLEHFEHHYRAEFSSLYKGFEEHLIRIGIGWHHANLYKVKQMVNYGYNPATGSTTYPTVPGTPLFSISDTPYVFAPERIRENHHLYLQDIWKYANDWELTAGIRYDHFSDFGSTTNPRLALVWATRYNLTTKLLYGEAFRSPNFTETYIQNNLTGKENPDLGPETIKTLELAFDYRPTGEIQFDLSLYHYDWQEIIQYVPGPDPADSPTAENQGRQTGYGLELAANWQASRALLLQGNGTWQKSTDEVTGKDAGYTPSIQIYLRADWRFLPNWYINSQLNWVADRKRSSSDLRDPVDDYTTVDLSLRHINTIQNWEFAIIARNVFDEDIREPSFDAAVLPNDMPMAGRSMFGEVRYQF